VWSLCTSEDGVEVEYNRREDEMMTSQILRKVFWVVYVRIGG